MNDLVEFPFQPIGNKEQMERARLELEVIQ